VPCFEVANSLIIGVVPACLQLQACWYNTNNKTISNFKTRHIVLPEDGPIGLKHVGEK